MDESVLAPNTSSVAAAGLFSSAQTITGNISAGAVHSVISDLSLFRAGNTVPSSLPHWEETEQQATSSAAAMTSLTNSSLHKDLGQEIGSAPETAAQLSNAQLIGQGGKHLDLPMTPPTSVDSGPSSESTSNHGNQSDSDPEMPPRKKRAPVPNEKKDHRYWERRRKNNVAAKRSREIRRKKMDDELKHAKDAIQENQKLKQEIEVLKAEINSLRRLLKDANMTLSLWIRAKQTSEPNSRLPPMLRGANVPFVNFPVSSAV